MTIVSKYTNASAAGAEIDRRARALVEGSPHLDYHAAARQVLAEDPYLARSYAQPASRVATTATKPAVPVPAPVLAQGKTPGETVHLRTVALREMDAGLTYQRAVNLVLAADPDLKAAYAGVQS
jgi:hypothetical protein